MRAFILALALCLCSVAAAGDGSVVVPCSITLTAAQYAALEVYAKNVSTPEAPATVESLVAGWALQHATLHAEESERATINEARAAEATKPVEERPIEAAVKAAVAAKAAAVVEAVEK